MGCRLTFLSLKLPVVYTFPEPLTLLHWFIRVKTYTEFIIAILFLINVCDTVNGRKSCQKFA